MALVEISPFVRERSEDDLSACERLARAVHLSDGYPVFVVDGDFRRFVASPAALAGWVAEVDGEIVGHVALHPATSLRAVRLLRSKVGVDMSQLGVIARLIVAPSARRRGIARELLDIAAAEARRRGLVPILDVVTRHEAAVALYENAGWTQLGTVDFELPDGTTVEEFVYRAPTQLPNAS
jgi:ribosomal protein S18 acetylase RimI-like enzyme